MISIRFPHWFEGILIGSHSALLGGAMAGAELISNQIDKEKHPYIREICITTAKVIQVTCALISLLSMTFILVNEEFANTYWNSFIFSTLYLAAVCSLGQVVIRIVQNSENETLKKIGNIADQILNKITKIINTIALSIPAAGILFIRFDCPIFTPTVIAAAVVGGAAAIGAITAVNYSLYSKE